GRSGLFDVNQMARLAAARGRLRPAIAAGSIDWNLVEELRSVRGVAEGHATSLTLGDDPGARARVRARQAYANGDLSEARGQWPQQSDTAKGLMDVVMLAEVLADAGDPGARVYLDQLRLLRPVEAEATLARWAYRAGQPEMASAHLIAALQ